ncbi:GTPase ObgE [soil metagenome]
MFIDRAKIFIKSGDGGNGVVSFRREKFVPKGGPNGGDGGKGGDIIFKASSQLTTLIDFTYKRHFKGGRGNHGEGGLRTGKGGKDEVIKVPCGSILKNEETGEVMAELLKDGEEIVVLRGGDGGRGNNHFKNSTNQAPRTAEIGYPGKEAWAILELKLIADAGLVGFPNAGKSTLISSISAAKPKIADYPFTTLIPNLGIVRYKEHESFVVADIPGIIEGASEGKGLGIQFLKHIERTKVLVFLIDSTQLIGKTTKKDFLKEYKVLLNELKSFSKNLLEKPRILCFSKSDAIDEDLKKKLIKIKTDEKKLLISSVSKENLDELKDLIWEMLESVK